MKDDPKSITVQEALERFKNGETTGAIQDLYKKYGNS